MVKIVNNFTNRTTMYRLVLYYLLALLAAAVILSFFGYLPFSPWVIIFSAVFITAVCAAANYILAKIFRAVTNYESAYITALILALIMAPIHPGNISRFFIVATSAAVIAMASKYILAVRRKHIFNPVALAVVVTTFTIGQGATWWAGTTVLFPFVLFGGLILLKKLQHFDLVLSFFTVSLLGTAAAYLDNPAAAWSVVYNLIVFSPLAFFAFVMLTEPLTTPPTRKLRILYGAFVGFLSIPTVYVGNFYSSPELALVVGNVFSFLVSPKEKLILTLKSKISSGHNIYDFVFQLNKKLRFKPGQYLEWTLDKVSLDSRGNRRYFTIASSPTESELRIGVKFYDKPSSFKKSLKDLNVGDKIIAGQRAGDFTMPKNKNKKMVFIAGGIGVTPFRSMIKYLLDKKQKRDIALFYSANDPADFAYKDLFDQAQKELGVKAIYTITNPQSATPGWQGKTGYVTKEMITENVPDYAERVFYLSGPRSMVEAFDKTLKELGVKKIQIKKDFFPGFA